MTGNSTFPQSLQCDNQPRERPISSSRECVWFCGHTSTSNRVTGDAVRDGITNGSWPRGRERAVRSRRRRYIGKRFGTALHFLLIMCLVRENTEDRNASDDDFSHGV